MIKLRQINFFLKHTNLAMEFELAIRTTRTGIKSTI